MNDFLKETLCKEIDDAKIKLVECINNQDRDLIIKYESIISDLENQLKALQ